MTRKNDNDFMACALRLAEQGRGWVNPNPAVGACLVKGSRVITQGFHRRFGGPHAEAEVLKRAGGRAKDGSLYVTFEPCSTWGKTPPCTSLIARSGVRRVVIGALDPNPLHNGRAVKHLRRSGILVKVGVLEDACRRQTMAFRKWIVTQRPFVTLKLAQSLDGKICTRSGESRWITGEGARRFVRSLRAGVDAVMVGKNTVLRDDPKLTPSLKRGVHRPWRIVLDARGELPLSRQVFKDGGRTMLICAHKSLRKIMGKFSKSNVSVLPVPAKRDSRLDLCCLMEKLGALGFSWILAEGGGEVAAELLTEGIADELYLFQAPVITGGRNAKTSVEGEGIKRLKQALRVRRLHVKKIEKDFLFHVCFSKFAMAPGNNESGESDV